MSIDIKILGEISYEAGLELQEELAKKILGGTGRDTIIVCEHPAVITAGKNTPASELRQVLQSEIRVVHTDRGGLVTGHNPGQVVIYPIVHLGARRIQVRTYIEILCEAVIEVLRGFGLNARTDNAFPGVWVGNSKICAVGIRVKERIARHGIALNVCNDLAIFSQFQPCGIPNRGVTSLLRELGKEFDPMDIGKQIARNLQETLESR